VHAERANKGILITTSTFTAQALRFAQDKPLELIDGVEYAALLEKYHLDGASVSLQDTITTGRAVEFEQGLVKLISCTSSCRDNPYECFVGSFGQLRPEENFSFVVCDVPTPLPNTRTAAGIKTMQMTERHGNFGSILENGSYFILRDVEYPESNLQHATTPDGNLDPEGLTELTFHLHERSVVDPDHFHFKCVCNHTTATVLFERFQKWRLRGFLPAQSHKAQPSQGCFVATVIYDGDPDCREVRRLRKWRDTNLAQYSFGRLFIALYCRAGPKLARLVYRHPSLKHCFRAFLDRVVSRLNR